MSVNYNIKHTLTNVYEKSFTRFCIRVVFACNHVISFRTLMKQTKCLLFVSLIAVKCICYNINPPGADEVKHA